MLVALVMMHFGDTHLATVYLNFSRVIVSNPVHPATLNELFHH
jgi:hypothetical protein